MGWSFPWVSYGDSDFNLDFAVFTEEAGAPARASTSGLKYADVDLHETELHGLSSFALQDDVVFYVLDLRSWHGCPERDLAAPRSLAEGTRR